MSRAPRGWRSWGAGPVGFQGEVTVTAGTAAMSGWTVSWQTASGRRVVQSWGAAAVTAAGTSVSAANASWNGTLMAGGTTTFGFIAEGTAATPALTCSAT